MGLKKALVCSDKGLIKVVALEDDETKPEKKGVGQNQRFVINIKYVK